MLDGLILLLTLIIVMTVTSFLAGALPLSLSLSSSQMRIISNFGMGILVGTSLIVIIPEGIESIYSAKSIEREHHLKRGFGISGVQKPKADNVVDIKDILYQKQANLNDIVVSTLPFILERDERTTKPQGTMQSGSGKTENQFQQCDNHDKHNQNTLTFQIGISLISGFILMFLIDNICRRASENLQSFLPTRHISLSNLSLNSHSGETSPGSESFLNSLTPTPKQTRSVTTTTGLVIHALSDGIAIGASITSSNIKLGLIIFLAIMLHKAPTAFGLTSILLKQGLSKRAIRAHLMIFSLATPAGAATTWVLIAILGASQIEEESGQWWVGISLLFSAGTFLYVSIHAVHQENSSNYSHIASNGVLEAGINTVPRKVSKLQLRDTLAAVCGMLVPLVTQLDHHH
ncbi:Zinc transporter [Erysiphe necator]|uniref:Putative zip zinc transporter n=1 Tax=Uncinula necator TaxID=52586 RepID=A0A0B1NXD2_UNCNE|nr:Zinc transporter [Erysiphe necator]KHJ30643.1 putative zip zinc transporter [Erysiphe necator]